MAELVSVIIPSFNGKDYIEDAIASAIKQSFREIEIIVIDDGSTDGTEEALAPYLSRGEIKYFKKENGGAGAARNFGVKCAKGEFVAFLDADDLWRADKLERQMPLFKDMSVGLVFSDAEYFGNGKTKFRTCMEASRGFFSGQPVAELLRMNFITTSSVVMRKSVFEKLNGFSEIRGHVIDEDYHLWLRVATACMVQYAPEALVKYRLHEGQISQGRRGAYRRLVNLFRILLDTSFRDYRFQLWRGYFFNEVKYLLIR